eukprot:gene23534-25015_t
MTAFSSRLAMLTAEPPRDTATDPARLARVERTRVELFGQGEAIRATLSGNRLPIAAIADRLAGRAIERIVVTGCGDSWFAGMAMRHALESLTGLPAEGAQALDYAAYGAAVANPATLVVGISSGGNTPAVMAALSAARARGAFTIGVSNTAGSPITTEFDAALLVQATRRGWPTQATNATMALLAALGIALAPDTPARGGLEQDLAALPDIIDRLCVALDAPLKTTAERWARADLVLFTGLGPNFAAASIGAAKIRELSPIHALALPLEEYLHYRSQKAGDPIVVVATDPRSTERALDTALVAGHVGGPLLAILAAPSPEIERRASAVVRLPEIAPALAELRAARRDGLHAAGYLSYEAAAAFEPALGTPSAFGMPILWFGLFAAFEEIAPEAVCDLLPDPAGAWTGEPVPSIDRSRYAAQFAEIQARIAAGALCQANLTHRGEIAVLGDPLSLYARLRKAARAGFGALIDTGAATILSLSPELFFALEGETLTCRPMKGTARRGATPAADAAAAAGLADDPKQRAENLMIVDLMRNDLARVARAGSVAVPQLFEVESYPTVHQLVSIVTAQIAPDTDALDVLA